MNIEQIYTKCLAQGSYFISSENEAVVIDPIRDIDIYTQKADELGVKITYIFETHFHADFVSGHIDLANETGAEIIFGPNGETGYSSRTCKDGEIFSCGKLQLKLLHTPGHTMESTSFLLFDEKGNQHSIYTGDTLFIGDVGRPDLAVKSDLTQVDLAGHLYTSLHEKILPLNDHIIVYPGHGAGSACGKNMSSETFSTLGEQRKNNYALLAESKETFIDMVLDGLSEPPPYFGKDVAQNKFGYRSLSEIKKAGSLHLSLAEFDKLNEHSIVIDTRTPDEFEKGHIPNSFSIGLNGQYAIWAATLIPLESNIVLITDDKTIDIAITRLARVGFENICGFISIEDWNSGLSKINSIEPNEFPNHLENRSILDVRQPGEFSNAHIDGAINIPLDQLKNRYSELDKNKEYLVHCAGGYRSMIASSILKQKNYERIINVRSGFSKLKLLENITINEEKCALTLAKEALESNK